MEQELDVKHQLIVSGASNLAYWASNFIFDILFGAFLVAGTLFAFGICHYKVWWEDPNIQAVLLMFALYIPTSCVYGYCHSFMYSSAGAALTGIILFQALAGTAGIQLPMILSEMDGTKN